MTVKTNVQLKTRKLYFICLFCLINLATFAQWECRSKCAAHLKPFHKKLPLSWAAELTFGQGYMNDREITNAMAFFALDYSIKKKHQFYLEVGRKSWRNTLDSPSDYNQDDDKFFNKVTHGIREGFYRFNEKNTKLTAGFHSMNFGDYFLVNERGLGLSYSQKINNFDLKVSGASVLKDFSRFGTFCSVHYLYNMLRDRNYAYIGEDIGETNFAGAVLKWKPNKKAKSKEGNNDEFSEFSEFSEPEKKEIFKEAGVVFYNEFGQGIDTLRIHYGLMSNWEMPGKIIIETEGLHQYAENNQALIGFIRAKKQFNWTKSQTYMHIAYFDKLNIDDNAMAYASYSNLFFGEVMRLDVMDMPLYQFAARHRIPKYQLHFKLQSTKQFKDQLISEYNFAVGKTFGRNVKLTTMFSMMDAISLEETYYLARAELRITL